MKNLIMVLSVFSSAAFAQFADYQYVKTTTTPTPLFMTNYNDSQSVGANNFLYGNYVNHNRTGGNGHRQAFTSILTTNGANNGEMLSSNNGFTFIETGSGNAFGLNGYVRILPQASGSAEAVSAEINTDTQRSVVRKVGVQIVDVNTSTGSGTVFDAGAIVARQTGGAGYANGLQFGLTSPSEFGVKAGGTLIRAATDSQGALRAGIDLYNVSAYTVAPILLRPNTNGVSWGANNEGGGVLSQTPVNGQRIIFANGLMVFRNSAGTSDALMLNDNDPNDKAYLFVGGALRQVKVGEPNSGGAGHRILRVLN